MFCLYGHGEETGNEKLLFSSTKIEEVMSVAFFVKRLSEKKELLMAGMDGKMETYDFFYVKKEEERKEEDCSSYPITKMDKMIAHHAEDGRIIWESTEE